jgi:phospholipase/carboxylesterase
MRLGAGTVITMLLSACGLERRAEDADQAQGTDMTATSGQATPGAQAAAGRLVARPMNVTQSAPTGLRQLGIVTQRDVLLYVPPQYRPDRPAPLALMLHGAGGDASGSLGLLQSFADEHGLILLGPASRDTTWDVIRGGYGSDVTVIDQALAQVFQAYAVDPQRLAVGGFSDGASYALSVGITNGDLFSHVIAFSPGFLAPADQQGTPRLFISHGTRDDVLPIDRCSRRIVPQLRRAGYDVLYHEFDGPHTVPPPIVREALDWYLGGSSQPDAAVRP